MRRNHSGTGSLEDKDMNERLQKILSARGVCSRRKAEELIQAGRVSCNGRVARLGDTADPDIDEILLDGKTLPSSLQTRATQQRSCASRG